MIGLTDSSGGVVERYAYGPYGERRVLAPDGTTVRQVSAYGNPLGHQGLYHDDETRLVYNRARYRDAGLGQFLNRDPLGYVDGLSLYLNYAASSSTVDPTGFRKCNSVSRRNRMRVPIPTGRIGPVKFAARGSFWWEIQGEECECCNKKTGRNDTTLNATAKISGRVQLSATYGIDEKFAVSGFKGQVWAGIRLEATASVSGSGSITKDGCSGNDMSADFCVNVNIGGAVRGGGNANVQLKWWFSVQVGVDLFGAWTKNGRACFSCDSNGCSLKKWSWEKGDFSAGLRVCVGPCFTFEVF